MRGGAGITIRRRTLLLCAAEIALAASPAHAQTVRLWAGAAPGSEQWTQKERRIESTPIGAVVLDVVTPTLTAYLPERGKATGTSVIVAPGGAFVALAIELEGTKVARWLQQRGIAAFVLKYRTIEKRQDGIPALDMDTAGRYGIADGIRAVAVVRQHAAQWGLRPDRVGFLGFSAGAMVASGALLQLDAAARPNFAALIYGGPFGVMPKIPPKLPPIFLAWAQDDAVALQPVERFRDALVAAGNRPEVHVFSAGGHGFGMKHQGTTSDHWIDELYQWLEAQGMRPASPRPNSAVARKLERERRRLDFLSERVLRFQSAQLGGARVSGTTVLTSSDDQTSYMLVRRAVSSQPEVHARWDDLVLIRSGTGAIEMGDSLVGSSYRGPGERRGGRITKRYELVVHAGDIVRIPAAVPHAFLVSGTEPLEYLMIKQRRQELPIRWFGEP